MTRAIMSMAMLGLLLVGPAGGAERRIDVSSYNLLFYADLYAGPQASPQRVTLPATLYVPDRTSGKIPAMVILHGSGGAGAHEAGYARDLVNQGIAGLVVDWFKGRGISNTGADQGQISFPSTAADALMAVKVLAAQPEIDPTRIGIVGFSRGATAQVMANSETLAERWLGSTQRIAAFVMFYAGCNRYQTPFKPMHAPVLILSGAEDTLTPAAACRTYAEDLSHAGVTAEVHVYPGAHHAFDYSFAKSYDAQYMSSANCPFRIDEGGTLILPDGSRITQAEGLADYARRCITRGVTLGNDPGAAMASRAAFRAFVTRYLVAP